MLKNNQLSWGHGIYSIGSSYLTKVLENMVNNQCDSVKFGETGKGISPHYQLEKDNSKMTFNGLNHEQHEYDVFTEKHISVKFNQDDVREAIRVANLVN